MEGFDLLLDQLFDPGTLREALASIFDVSPDQVGVVDAVEELEYGKAVNVVRIPTDGDFRCHLAIYPLDVAEPGDCFVITRRLCTRLNCRSFVPDDSINPWSGFLIRSDADDRVVALDPEAEERGEYRLLTGNR